MRKAQAAMEFLMTYGWAILVVLVAIGALAYFGVLSPEKFLPEKCVISTGSGLFCDDFNADSGTGEAITLKIKNILTDSVVIAIDGITIKLSDTKTCTGPAVETTINGDSSKEIVVGTGCTLDDGEKIKGEITIEFKPTDGLKKATTGQIITTASPLT